MRDREPTAERLLTIKELARAWDVCEATIRRRIKANQIEAVRLSKSAIRIRESVAARYLADLEERAAA